MFYYTILFSTTFFIFLAAAARTRLVTPDLATLANERLMLFLWGRGTTARATRHGRATGAGSRERQGRLGGASSVQKLSRRCR